MAKQVSSFLKEFAYNNKPYILTENGNQQSREVALKYIYRADREKYPKRFREYVVHHIDMDTLNNSIKNLYLCTPLEHNFIHKTQRDKRIVFENAKEIEIFLKENFIPKSQTKLPQVEEQKLIPKETPKAETQEDEEDSSYESSDIYPYGNNPVLQLTAKDLKNIRKEKWKIWEEEQKEKQKKKLKEKPKIKTYNPKHKELGFKEVIEIIFWIIMATLLIKAVLLFGS